MIGCNSFAWVLVGFGGFHFVWLGCCCLVVVFLFSSLMNLDSDSCVLWLFIICFIVCFGFGGWLIALFICAGLVLGYWLFVCFVLCCLPFVFFIFINVDLGCDCAWFGLITRVWVLVVCFWLCFWVVGGV